jgi:hypothetical protein
MSAKDHMSMQFKITPAQEAALQTWLVDYSPEDSGFTHNFDSKTPSISVHHLGRAALSMSHVANNIEFANEEYKQRGAMATAKGLMNLHWKLRDQHDIAQAASVMVGGPKKELYE